MMRALLIAACGTLLAFGALRLAQKLIDLGPAALLRQIGATLWAAADALDSGRAIYLKKRAHYIRLVAAFRWDPEP